MNQEQALARLKDLFLPHVQVEPAPHLDTETEFGFRVTIPAGLYPDTLIDYRVTKKFDPADRNVKTFTRFPTVSDDWKGEDI